MVTTQGLSAYVQRINQINHDKSKNLKGKAILKEIIIKMKDILFPNILVQVSYKSVEK